MYRLPTSSLALCVLVLSCGAPAELDRDAFPTPDQTGYDDIGGNPVGGAGMGGSTGTGNGGTTGTGQGGTVAGSGGTVAGSGGTVAGSGGTTGGTGATNNGSGGTAPGGTGGAQGGTGEPAPGGCPSDITVLFNRPGNEGGCAGGGCHIAGGTSPDLVSPGVVERLLSAPSTCNSRPYLGPDSFLAEKVSTATPDCGGAEMPFFQGMALSAEDEQCIVEWAEQAGGGG